MAKYVVDLGREFESAVKKAAQKQRMSNEDFILRAVAAYVVDTEQASKPVEQVKKDESRAPELVGTRG